MVLTNEQVLPVVTPSARSEDPGLQGEVLTGDVLSSPMSSIISPSITLGNYIYRMKHLNIEVWTGSVNFGILVCSVKFGMIH